MVGSGAAGHVETEDRILNAGRDALTLAQKETRFKRESQGKSRVAVSSQVGEIEVNESKHPQAESAAEWGERHAMALKAVEPEPNSQIRQD